MKNSNHEHIEQMIPKHVAIVMDGNGRWAKKRHLPRIAGHKVGAESVRAAVRFCSNAGVKVLTLFAFSTENWTRPKTEVSFLMNLFIKMLKKEVKELHENQVQLQVIGNRSELNKKLQDEIEATENFTAKNTGMKLALAINYSGRWDLTQAMQKIGFMVEKGELQAKDISPELIQANLCLGNLPEPDLFIRTSGEERISNFMLWQLAYTELYFTEILWPDFREDGFRAAFLAFNKRERRFGGVT